MAGNSRAESARRIIELTGLGIAATYFLDPDHGAERRRATRRWLAGIRNDRAVNEPPSTAALAAATGSAATSAIPNAIEPEEPTFNEPPATPTAAEELVLLSSDQLSRSTSPRQEVQWPRWGWALVLTITICAIAAFAAVGLGIWAIKNRTSTTTTRTLTTSVTSAAPVLADPAALRIIGTATRGNVILRLDPAGAALAVDGLPALPPRIRYRVWITAAGTTTAAGNFASQRAILAIKPLAAGSRITITRQADTAARNAPHGPQVATVTVPQ